MTDPEARYCTGCCQRKRHSRFWFGEPLEDFLVAALAVSTP